MNDWINLSALWRIVVLGILAGAGLPAVFAVGLRALGAGTAKSTDGDQLVGSNPAGIAAAGVCFAVVLGGIAWGIYFIVNGS